LNGGFGRTLHVDHSGGGESLVVVNLQKRGFFERKRVEEK